MSKTVCPFLGLRDDPTSLVGFPSEGNYCHRAPSIPPVSRDYQQRVCLRAEHVDCPVFINAAGQSLPPGMLPPRSRSLHPTRLVWLFLPAILLVIGLTAGLWKKGLAFQWRSSSYGEQRHTGSPDDSLSPELTASLDSSGRDPAMNLTPGDSEKMLSTSTITTTACPYPPGWVPYTVKPTDSIFRLSLVYGVSLKDLQKANCLGNSTLLKPGLIIYVPVPTVTPSPTTSPTPNSTNTLTVYKPPLPTETPTRLPVQPSKTPRSQPVNTPVIPGGTPPGPSNTPLPPPTKTPVPPPTKTPAPPLNTPTSAPPNPSAGKDKPTPPGHGVCPGNSCKTKKK